jgi:Tol biopolymer transport system component
MTPAHQDVRVAVDRILSSVEVAGSERLGRFLRYVVEETLAGRADEIKEYSIGTAVYKKSGDFDPRLDSTVRVEAMRLRRKLARYYETEGSSDLVQIVVPKGSYVPTAVGRVKPAKPVKGSTSRVKKWVIGAGLALVAMVFAWKYLLLPRSGAAELREVPLTSLPGFEMFPSFSPDGEAVAFMWNGGEERGPRNFRVYLMPVKGGVPRRLTQDLPAGEISPAWSPKGDQIALVAGLMDSQSLYLVSPINGESRQVGPIHTMFGSALSWSPDATEIVVSHRETEDQPYSIYAISLETGMRRRMTQPAAGILGDVASAFSPDGRSLALVRSQSQLDSDLYVMPRKGGEPKRLTTDRADIQGIAWMPVGNQILMSSRRKGPLQLWRVAAARGATELVAGVSSGISFPAVARAPGRPMRIAYGHMTANYNVWRAKENLSGADGRLRLERVAPSTRTDYDPDPSPDGKRVAFASDRSGAFEIWVSDRDGANPTQLTSFGGPDLGSPRWSPDGHTIAFDAKRGGNSDIYAVPELGGLPRRLTDALSEDARPSWSRDGKWIYFRSDRSGAHEVWKIPYAERQEGYPTPVRVTHGGGWEAFESVDGRVLFFVRQRILALRESSELWMVPLPNGREERVLEKVRRGLWSVTDRGVYWLETHTGSEDRSDLRVYNTVSRQQKTAGFVDKLLVPDTPAFSATSDGKSFLFAFIDRLASDLVLAENFQ